MGRDQIRKTNRYRQRDGYLAMDHLSDLSRRIIRYVSGKPREYPENHKIRNDFDYCQVIDFLRIIKYCEVVRFSNKITIERKLDNYEWRQYSWSVILTEHGNRSVYSIHSNYIEAYRAAERLSADLYFRDNPECRRSSWSDLSDQADHQSEGGPASFSPT